MREGCPHCATAEAFLATLGKERPELKIAIRDVGKEPSALARLKEIAKAQEDGQRARAGSIRTRTAHRGLFARSKHGQAHSRGTGVEVGGDSGPSGIEGAAACDAEESLSCRAGPEVLPGAEQFEVTIFGHTISLDDIGMPLFTVVMGLLDGFNPCSMWVLILMISLLAPLNNRPRMLAIAGTFVLIEGIAYFAFMAAWLNLFLFIGLSRVSELVIASIAIFAGARQSEGFPGIRVGGFPFPFRTPPNPASMRGYVASCTQKTSRLR